MNYIIKGMTIDKKDAQSCICTINMLRNLAYNTTGVLDWIDHENCDKIIEMLETLIELPPHGRLGDLDKLNIRDVSPVDGFCVMGVTEEDIGLAETVIEAEGET